MKPFTNLPHTLRVIFGVLRLVTLLFALLWVLGLTFSTTIRQHFSDEPRLMVTAGELSLKIPAAGVELPSNGAKSGSLALVDLRGMLQVDLLNNDAALTRAVKSAIIPAMLISVAFAWLLFTALRNVCANIERGDLFSETNLRLVQRVGVVLIAYSLAGILVQLWASHVMGSYLDAHVVLGTPSAGSPFPATLTPLRFSVAGAQFPAAVGFVTGGVVLMISEAFRQGLALKTESDLTV